MNDLKNKPMSKRVGIATNGEMVDPADVNMEELKEIEKAFRSCDLDDDGFDQIDHPTHYQSYNTEIKIECIDAMRAAFGDEATAIFCKLNAFKYVWRSSSKGLNTDIHKAIWYLNKFLELGGYE